MHKIDTKDRRILFELDSDARQSYSQIAKKVRLSKVAVMNRIINLEREKIILGYQTIIDTMRLGYTTYDIYLKFNNTTPEKEKEIIEYLVKHKSVWFVVSTMGMVDLVILISTKTALEYYEIWEEIHQKLKPNIRIVRTAILIEYFHYPRNYLITNSGRIRTEIFVGKIGNENIDEKDFELLKCLSKNGRASIVDIARKIDLGPSATIYRIKALEKKNIIQGYRMNFNFKKYGYEYYKVYATLNNLGIKKKIREWITQQENVVYYDGFIGGYDIEFDLEIENSNRFIEFIYNFKKMFGKNIQEIEHFTPILFHKATYFPEEKGKSF